MGYIQSYWYALHYCLHLLIRSIATCPHRIHPALLIWMEHFVLQIRSIVACLCGILPKLQIYGCKLFYDATIMPIFHRRVNVTNPTITYPTDSCPTTADYFAILWGFVSVEEPTRLITHIGLLALDWSCIINRFYFARRRSAGIIFPTTAVFVSVEICNKFPHWIDRASCSMR